MIATKTGETGTISAGNIGGHCAISVIVPAYNEQRRLPCFLRRMRGYFEAERGSRYEVIVVDDGSDDGTLDYLEGETRQWPRLSLIRHLSNLGKGAAVRTGMLAARGELLLFADADGATPIEEELKLRCAIAAGADVAIGSRALGGREAVRCRTLVRGCAGRLFRVFYGLALGIPFQDAQCGFKMFRRAAATRLFTAMTEPGFAFDLELLVLARQIGYRVAEVPVAWREVPGSKVRLWRDGPRMVRSAIRIRRRLPFSRAAAHVAAAGPCGESALEARVK